MNTVKKYCTGRIGEKYITTEGYTAEKVAGGRKNTYCTVSIGNWTTEVQVGLVRRGGVKYPYHKSVYGVGCFGVGEHKAKIDGKVTKEYAAWCNMLKRCYDPVALTKRPTYKDCSVCEEWLNFQVFADWLEDSNYTDGLNIDKDLLTPGNKIYSPDTCLLIPASLNNILTNVKSSNKSGYIGVCYEKCSCKYKATIRIENKTKHLGRFKTAEEAAEAYKLARAERADQLREIYKDLLPEKALAAIR